MLTAGTARTIITPPIGLELSGFSFGPSIGVLDNLEAQALVFGSAEHAVALITADVIGFAPELVNAVRKRCEATLGIPAAHVLLAGSHTHSGPATMFLRYWGACDAEYLRVLESHLVGLVTIAQRNAREARVGIGLGGIDTISQNRRVAGGVIDSTVPVLRVDDAIGQPLAVLYNFASHPISLHSYQNLISPDYPGYVRSVMRAVLGSDVVVLFTQGAAGDIEPRLHMDWYLGESGTPQRVQRAQQLGAMLGCEVAKIALGIESQGNVPLRVERAVIELPVEPLPVPAELQTMRDRSAAEAARRRAEGKPDWEVVVAEIERDWASEALRAWDAGPLQQTRSCEIQGIRVGDAAILALPLEVFVETGLAIKADSLAKLTLISSMSNGALGYLPTHQAYEVEDYTNPQGLAPKVYDLYAFAPEAEPLVRQHASQILRSLGWD